MRFRAAFALLLTIGYFFIFNHWAEFDDGCYFGGDTWEYQSMAVNLVRGHGLARFGQIEPFSEYKVTFGQTAKISKFKNYDKLNFYRRPGYHFFLALIYKIGGVHPINAKRVQLFLL